MLEKAQGYLESLYFFRVWGERTRGEVHQVDLRISWANLRKRIIAFLSSEWLDKSDLVKPNLLYVETELNILKKSFFLSVGLLFPGLEFY